MDKVNEKITNPDKIPHRNLKKDKLIFVRNLIILFIFSLITLVAINRNGQYPWGSDTYGHLYKANILFDSIKKGTLFLNYDRNWYNGVQPYRYWAPFPYYILAVINMFTNNMITTFDVFVELVFMVGGMGWLFWGYYTRRQNIAIVLAILWFFIPDNLRVLFSEGNIPFVTVISISPMVFFYYYKSMMGKKIRDYLRLAMLMSILTLTHAMISAIVGMALFIVGLAYAISKKRYYENIISLVYALLGMLCSSFWLYPALKGGIMSIDKGAVSDVMQSLTYPLTVSLDPFLRFKDIEMYYFGLSFGVVILFGILFATRNEIAPFVAALIILLGTTKSALPLLVKLPMNQLFWMRRFTAFAIAMIFIGLITWIKLRKSILIIILISLVVDSSASFYILGYNRPYPGDIAKTIDIACSVAKQRVGVLDNSTYGSFPTYYISYNSVNGVKQQVYGWAWQGATTANNIVTLNTALENHYFGLMFDRALEVGADTLVIRKRLITKKSQYKELDKYAAKVGYVKYTENDDAMIYRYPVKDTFGTEVNYEGIAIGSYASNITYLFPKFEVGTKPYFDDYTYGELKNKKAVYLAGFKYRDRDKAEELVLKLSRSGVKVLIDITGMGDSGFLNVTGQPIVIKNKFDELYFNGNKLNTAKFPSDYPSWNANFLNGVNNRKDYVVVDHRLIKYVGNKDNKNLTFIGLNIPYFVFLTKDEGLMKVLEQALDMKSYELPKRVVKDVKIQIKDNNIKVKGSSKEIVPIAALDSFVKLKGDYNSENNLIHLKSSSVEVKIIYPHMGVGIVISIIIIALTTALSIYIKLKNKDMLEEGDE
ncbi:hypothetical protein NL50_03845 [Clostridium acetobutylicum]|nr:hypothetical protein NL50_03845 [Clostridium acetobutylicum]